MIKLSATVIAAIPTKPINSWQEYEEQISDKPFREWAFRGQSDLSWKLESSLYRLFIDIDSIIKASRGKGRVFARNRHEAELINAFKSQAHLYLDTRPSDREDLEWLSLMQHYGTPTRLLDMTFSPYVAAFFALERGRDDCSVYALDLRHFANVDLKAFGGIQYKESVIKTYLGKKVAPFFFAYEPKMKSARIVAQQGLFLVSSTNHKTYDEIIGDARYALDSDVCIKYILGARMRYEALKKLKLMNINSATLFPGIDGFCRSLGLQVLENIDRLKRKC